MLIDKYLEDAIEIDVDALSDGKAVVIGGVLVIASWPALGLREYNRLSDLIPGIADSGRKHLHAAILFHPGKCA